MWKKLLLCMGLALALTAAAQAAEATAEVTMRSLVPVQEGVELSYHVDNAGTERETALALAGLYNGNGALLALRTTPLDIAAGGWQDVRVVFPPEVEAKGAAVAKVFVLDSWTGLRPLGPAGTMERSEEILITSWAELVEQAPKAPKGAVYRLKSGVIPCNSELKLKGKTPLTVRGSAEGTTILDFSGWSDSLLGTPKEVSYTGISLEGSNITLENLIIQGAPGVGVRMKSENSHHDLAQDVVTRYNHNSGFYLSESAHHCTLRQCDSYRNCDIYKKGQDADGYSVSLQLGAHVLMDNCRAFENADDAYDNFNNHNDVTYLDCYAWNNGGIDCYTGQQDVDRGFPVDRDLGLVRLMCKQSPAFQAALDAGRFELPLDMTMTVRDPINSSQSIQVTLGQYITTVWEGNGNGFKLGSGAYDEAKGRWPVGAEAFRRLENCIAFDNGVKGFDRNNGTFRVSVTNFLSFGNGRNYSSDKLSSPVVKNALSYREGSAANSTDANFPITALNSTRGEALVKQVYRQAAQLEAMLREDQIPGRFLIELDW